jgi:hypothetical protein
MEPANHREILGAAPREARKKKRLRVAHCRSGASLKGPRRPLGVALLTRGFFACSRGFYFL